MLDINKVIHFPITFVIKTEKLKDLIQTEFVHYIAKKSGGMKIIKDSYHNAIKEIITINELKNWIVELPDIDIDTIIQDIELYYKIEMNII